MFYHGRGEYLAALSGFIGEPIWPGRTAAETREAIRHEARYLGPPDLPPRCNRALSRPPVHAETLDYSDDLRPVRSFVASRAARAGLAPPRIADLVLAAGELAANTVCHTDAGGTVLLWRAAGEIICQVADTGHLTDPLAWHRPPTDELLGGNGLWLVNQVCDLVQARTGPAGTTIRLHMRLRRPSPDSTSSWAGGNALNGCGNPTAGLHGLLPRIQG